MLSTIYGAGIFVLPGRLFFLFVPREERNMTPGSFNSFMENTGMPCW